MNKKKLLRIIICVLCTYWVFIFSFIGVFMPFGLYNEIFPDHEIGESATIILSIIGFPISILLTYKIVRYINNLLVLHSSYKLYSLILFVLFVLFTCLSSVFVFVFDVEDGDINSILQENYEWNGEIENIEKEDP